MVKGQKRVIILVIVIFSALSVFIFQYRKIQLENEKVVIHGKESFIMKPTSKFDVSKYTAYNSSNEIFEITSDANISDDDQMLDVTLSVTDKNGRTTEKNVIVHFEDWLKKHRGKNNSVLVCSRERLGSPAITNTFKDRVTITFVFENDVLKDSKAVAESEYIDASNLESASQHYAGIYERYTGINGISVWKQIKSNNTLKTVSFKDFDLAGTKPYEIDLKNRLIIIGNADLYAGINAIRAEHEKDNYTCESSKVD